jgi:hypothetical protein
MKLLQPFCNVDEDEDEDEEGWLTPLAEVPRQGFVEGVRYLLSLESVTVNSINSCDHGTMTELVFKTPLDLAIEGKHTERIELLKTHGALTILELEFVG